MCRNAGLESHCLQCQECYNLQQAIAASWTTTGMTEDQDITLSLLDDEHFFDRI